MPDTSRYQPEEQAQNARSLIFTIISMLEFMVAVCYPLTYGLTVSAVFVFGSGTALGDLALNALNAAEPGFETVLRRASLSHDLRSCFNNTAAFEIDKPG